MLAVAGGILLVWLVLLLREQIVLLCWGLLVVFVVTMGLYGASQPKTPHGVVRVER